MNIELLTVDSARTAVLEKQITATALVDAFYQKIEAEDPAIGAYLTLSKDRAHRQAERVDALADKGDALPPLAGVPIAIKDVLTTKGVRTTAGSKILDNFIAPYDATAVARLDAAGAIVLGKTNCDEFAMGSSNENSGFHPVKNPRDHVAGTGRLVGRFGRCDCRRNRRRFAGLRYRRLDSSARSVLRRRGTEADLRTRVALWIDRLRFVARSRRSLRQDSEGCRADPAAHGGPRSLWTPPPPTCRCRTTSQQIGEPVKGMRIGVPKEYFGEGLDPEVRAAVEAGIQELAKAGCEIVSISLPHTEYAIPTYYLIATAEASSNLARFDGVRYGVRAKDAKTLAEMYRQTRDAGFGTEVKRRIMLGTYALSAGYYDAYYLKAQRVRSLLARDFDEAFAKVDAIVTPTTPTPAFKLGEKADDPLAMYLADIYTVTANLVGVPGITVPCGKSKEGLPIGLQILGKHFDEATVLRTAHVVEHAMAGAHA